nr:uncharacterized protein LOC117990825 [Maniola hyperantus]
MSVKSSRMYTAPVPKMPPGLVEVMEGLAKDVLKCNPPDVYSFCANHMQRLIEIRDGPTPKCAMTLEQKVAMAIKKIRERAARRREDYDKKVPTDKQPENRNNEGYENNSIDKNDSDARQYVKDKIVKIPEEDIAGEEHEIIVNIKDKSLSSEPVKLTEIDTEIKSSDNDLPATSHESIITNDVKNDNETIEEISILKKTTDLDEITLCSSIITEEENTNKDQISSHFLEEQDKTMSSTPSALHEGDEILNLNNIELENHVNNTSMDLETAAITIQKVFRNFLFKNKTLSTDDATDVDINSLIEDKTEKGDNDMSIMNVNKDRRTLGLSRMDTVLQTVNEEKSLSQSTDDSSTLSSAATIIQAHVRGYLIRNKLNLNKNSSTTSGVDSDGLSFTSMEGDNDCRKNKTILNIHIVPESGHFMSRDESVLTSIDLSMDGSPPCSTNLHPLGYDTSERRKQLKREDAFQSTSPPSNNSGKLSEDVDSIKELLISENNKDENPLLVETGNTRTDVKEFVLKTMLDDVSTVVDNLDTALEVKSLGSFDSPEKHLTERPYSLPELTLDEMDVITPFTPSEDKLSNNSNLIHSGEFHEVVLPTQVSRSDTSVVREFQNVLVYFLLWNNA